MANLEMIRCNESTMLNTIPEELSLWIVTQCWRWAKGEAIVLCRGSKGIVIVRLNGQPARQVDASGLIPALAFFGIEVPQN
jgi:hypothetical protein